ncbi:MAG: hypothetical protein HG422_06460 [Prevotella sp.]|jgi:hypothetical protein|nr:hypothetical protein [Prevotella sp.]
MRKLILTLVVALTALTASAVNKPEKVYMYGFAASFNDSTVYFTSLQEIDSVYIDSKTKFLYSRDNYSYQLRDYLSAHGAENYTCTTVFALNRKAAEKKYAKLRKRYTQGGKYTVKDLSKTDFFFVPIKEQE